QLTVKDGKSLNKFLNKALKETDINKTDKAIKDLAHFIDDVNKLIQKGRLSNGEGQSLIASAQKIIDQLQGIIPLKRENLPIAETGNRKDFQGSVLNYPNPTRGNN